MPDNLEERLAALPKLSTSALRELWTKLCNSSPPFGMHRQLMIPILAYRIQEEALGFLKENTLLRLRQLATAAEEGSTAPPALKPGTRLVRQWRDQVHLVNVDDRGYEYRGGRYKSLSEIARQITGTRWSGPAFFGLGEGPAAQQKEKR
jgi:Protein of unknown function (DUF2924)